jgi:hypothetical protein
MQYNMKKYVHMPQVKVSCKHDVLEKITIFLFMPLLLSSKCISLEFPTYMLLPVVLR